MIGNSLRTLLRTDVQEDFASDAKMVRRFYSDGTVEMTKISQQDQEDMGVGKGLGGSPPGGLASEYMKKMTEQLALQRAAVHREWQIRASQPYVSQEVWRIREWMLEDLMQKDAGR